MIPPMNAKRDAILECGGKRERETVFGLQGGSAGGRAGKPTDRSSGVRLAKDGRTSPLRAKAVSRLGLPPHPKARLVFSNPLRTLIAGGWKLGVERGALNARNMFPGCGMLNVGCGMLP